jgi:hypothetical protein
MTDWHRAAQVLHQHRLRMINELKPQFDVPLRQGPRDAPGYRFLGEVYFTFEHPLFPTDPAATRAMKEDLPDYVPIWGRWYFLEDVADAGGWREIYFDRHVIARNVKSARMVHHFGRWGNGKNIYRAQLVGPEPKEGWPNYLEGPWHYKRGRELPHPDIPGDFAPHGMEMVRFLRDVRVRARAGQTSKDAWSQRLVHVPMAEARRRAAGKKSERDRIETERRRYEERQREKAGDTDFDRQIVQQFIQKRDVKFNLGNGATRMVRLPLPPGFQE